MNAFEQKIKTWFAFEQGAYKKTLQYVKKEINMASSRGELNTRVRVPLDEADKIRDYFMLKFFWVDIPVNYYERNYSMLYISWK